MQPPMQLHETETCGTLYIVATPIGNREDISLRAIQTLKSVDHIAAEDTRHSAPLLHYHGIKRPMLALHEHNEQQRSTAILKLLQQGQDVALISDAGTPLISDPGYRLVNTIQQAGCRVSPVPGPSSIIAALSASGLATDRFLFVGFPPAKPAARITSFADWRHEPGTVILLESSHRIQHLADDLANTLEADRDIVIARELTKTFETLKRCKLHELPDWLRQSDDNRRGEFVVLIQGIPPSQTAISADADQVLKLLANELPASRAAKLAAQLLGQKKSALYQRLLELEKTRS